MLAATVQSRSGMLYERNGIRKGISTSTQWHEKLLQIKSQTKIQNAQFNGRISIVETRSKQFGRKFTSKEFSSKDTWTGGGKTQGDHARFKLHSKMPSLECTRYSRLEKFHFRRVSSHKSKCLSNVWLIHSNNWFVLKWTYSTSVEKRMREEARREEQRVRKHAHTMAMNIMRARVKSAQLLLEGRSLSAK